MKKGIRFYFTLFISTFKLSAFTFGGGYIIVPLMKKQFVETLGWIDEKEMLDYTAIAQSAPGSMAVNAAVMLGYQLAGIPGVAITVLATMLPPLILLSIISIGYNAFIENQIIRNILKGMQAGVCAVIIDVVIDMSHLLVKEKKIVSILLMIAACVAVFVFRVNAAWVILICALAGLLTALKKSRKGGDEK